MRVLTFFWLPLSFLRVVNLHWTVTENWILTFIAFSCTLSKNIVRADTPPPLSQYSWFVQHSPVNQGTAASRGTCASWHHQGTSSVKLLCVFIWGCLRLKRDMLDCSEENKTRGKRWNNALHSTEKEWDRAGCQGTNYICWEHIQPHFINSTENLSELFQQKWNWQCICCEGCKKKTKYGSSVDKYL